MDKYFSPTYDPRLDVTLDSVTDTSTGLIGEGWDAMLDVVKARKAEKEEKKEAEWLAKVERKRERERVRREREQRREERGGEGAKRVRERIEDEVVVVHGPGFTKKDEGMMGMSYVKRGETRSWDLGKETPT